MRALSPGMIGLAVSGASTPRPLPGQPSIWLARQKFRLTPWRHFELTCNPSQFQKCYGLLCPDLELLDCQGVASELLVS
jgi:hypothetical protein